MAVITISRELGSGGDEIARRVCRVLGYRYADMTLLAEVAREQGFSDTELVDFSEDSYRGRGFIDALLGRPEPVVTAVTWTTTTLGADVKVSETLDQATAAEFVTRAIRVLGNRGQVVIVGRGGQGILRNQPAVLHVRIIARLEDRVQRVSEGEGLTREAAGRRVTEHHRASSQYLRRFHGIDWSDPTLYHLTLNTSRLSQEEAAQLIADAAQRLEARSQAKQSSVPIAH